MYLLLFEIKVIIKEIFKIFHSCLANKKHDTRYPCDFSNKNSVVIKIINIFKRNWKLQIFRLNLS